MIGSYNFTSYGGFYWMRNSRKVYKFRYDKNDKKPFVVFDGMNIKNKAWLDIPEAAHKKLVRVLNEKL